MILFILCVFLVSFLFNRKFYIIPFSVTDFDIHHACFLIFPDFSVLEISNQGPKFESHYTHKYTHKVEISIQKLSTLHWNTFPRHSYTLAFSQVLSIIIVKLIQHVTTSNNQVGDYCYPFERNFLINTRRIYDSKNFLHS